jgi:leucyl-tRNA synthetase
MVAKQNGDRNDREKMYVLAEFPYPSGYGLHIGHTFTYTAADVYARFLRMQGKHVLFPMGWDAFGLPTENYAIRTGRKPQGVTRENTENYQKQMQSLGFSFDWERMVDTTDPAYYKWTQWIFIRLFKHGLAFKQEMPINWCPKDKIGLANEEVIDGRCERCGTETVRRLINQWVVKITAYADRLIEDLELTELIPKVKASQINWIGRSEGANIRFKVKDRPETLEVFTTRPDTLWGCTFMVIAPEHSLAKQVIDNSEVARYIQASGKRSEIERTDLGREKSGVFSGFYAIHPATGEELPIWISDFVLMSYGTGAIMAVPAHDSRDYAFARTYDLPIKPVIMPEEGWDFSQAAYEEHQGRAVHSGPIDGLPVDEAIPAAIAWLVEGGLGDKAVTYHLRDWIFSRQRYWGEPIPMIFCQDCGWLPVPDEELPVILPEVDRYEPTDTGESPLANIDWWVQTTCPKCKGPARRETDTMPNWAGSDWYFLRFTDPHNDQRLADMEKMRYWLPVDVYIGGDEHNTLHLLYSRFIYKFLYDIGAVPQEYPEPYKKRLSHGVILAPDGTRMSKSRGNVVLPDEMAAKYGVDVVRAYLMFIGPFDATMAWNENALAGVRRFLDRFGRFIENANPQAQSSQAVILETNRAIKGVTEDIPQFKFNTALAKMMEGLNSLVAQPVGLEELRAWVYLIAPFAPFLAEEWWQKLGLKGSVHTSGWPVFDPALAEDALLEIPVQVNGKLRGLIQLSRDAGEEEARQQAESLDTVQKYLSQGTIRKVIYVPGRTLNYVVR